MGLCMRQGLKEDRSGVGHLQLHTSRLSMLSWDAMCHDGLHNDVKLSLSSMPVASVILHGFWTLQACEGLCPTRMCSLMLLQKLRLLSKGFCQGGSGSEAGAAMCC